MCNNCLENICNIIEAICAVLNICIVYYIFKSERKNSIELEQRREKLDWYNKLQIMNMSISFSNFLDANRNNLSELSVYNATNLKQKTITKKQNEIVEKIRKEFYIYKNQFILAIECFDEKKVNEATSKLEEIDDKIAELLNIMRTAKSEKEISEKIYEIRKMIIMFCSKSI